MFTVVCTTCDAKIVVKNEALIGQILACPKCGGMVLIERPEADSPVAVAPVDSTAWHGGAEPPEPAKREEPGHPLKPPPLPLPPPSGLPDPMVPLQGPPVSEQEMRVRRFLLLGLGFLFAVLLFAVGFFVFFGDDGVEQEPPEEVATVSDHPGPPEIAPQNIPLDDPPALPPTALPDTPPEPSDSGRTDPAPVETAPETQTDPGAPPEKQPAEDAQGPERPDGLVNPEKIETEITVPAPNLADAAPTLRPGTDTQETEIDHAAALRDRLAGLLSSRRESFAAEDVAPRLNIPLRALKIEQIPLREVVRTLARLTGVPMTFELESMRGAGIAVDLPVSVALEETTAWDALESVLEPLGMSARIEEGQVTLVAENPVLERGFPVEDLLQSLPPERLREAIVSLVVPGATAPNDEPDVPPAARTLPGFARVVAEVTAENEERGKDEASVTREDKPVFAFDAVAGKVMLWSDAATADRLLKLLEMLRVLRELPPRSTLKAETLTPETFGWDTLRQPFTLNYFQPVPLERALGVLEKGTLLPLDAGVAGVAEKPVHRPEPLYVVLDHLALYRAGIRAGELNATVQCNNGTLDEALDGLLASLETVPLAFRIITKNLVEIGTLEELNTARKMSIEPHRLPKNLRDATADKVSTDAPTDAPAVPSEKPARPASPAGDDTDSSTPRTVAEFLHLLKTTFEPESWQPENSPGGGPSDGGAIYVDEPSGTIFIRQSQPVQRKIRLLIESMDRGE